MVMRSVDVSRRSRRFLDTLGNHAARDGVLVLVVSVARGLSAECVCWGTRREERGGLPGREALRIEAETFLTDDSALEPVSL